MVEYNSSLRPNLLRVNQVLERLETTRPQLQNLYPYLHILNLPRNNRRFPLVYILGLADYLHTSYKPPHIYAVREFARTQVATAAIETAETGLETAIRSHSKDGYC